MNSKMSNKRNQSVRRLGKRHKQGTFRTLWPIRRLHAGSRRVAFAILGICLGGLALLALLMIPAPAEAAGHAPVSNAPIHPDYLAGSPTSSHVLGSPAITPHLAGGGNTRPTYTDADIVSVVTHNPMPHTVNPSAYPTVMTVGCTTDQAIRAMLHGEEPGEAPNSLLCYAIVRGTFTFPGPGSSSVTYHKGIEVFDGHTGNIILWGGLK